MTSTSDSNCRDPPISPTDKVAPIMAPVIVDPLSSSSPNLTTNIDSNPSIFDIDITVSHFVNKDGSIFKMIYALKIKSNFTIDELISYIVSLKDINVFRGRVNLIYDGTQLYNFPGSDKLSDYGIKQDSIISMTFRSIITDSLNKKRSLNDNFVKDVKPDKRSKGDNDNGKDNYIHNNVMLCYIVLCYIILCCVMLIYVILYCCVVLCCVVLY